MSSTVALATARATTRRRHGLRTAAVLAALVATTAAVGAGAAPANAAPATFPVDGSGWTAIVETAASAPFAASVESLRAALTALPDSSEIHIDQVLKNYATGAMR